VEAKAAAVSSGVQLRYATCNGGDKMIVSSTRSVVETEVCKMRRAAATLASVRAQSVELLGNLRRASRRSGSAAIEMRGLAPQRSRLIQVIPPVRSQNRAAA
jgi:hypothetical protein